MPLISPSLPLLVLLYVVTKPPEYFGSGEADHTISAHNVYYTSVQDYIHLPS